MNVFELAAKLTLDSSQYDKGLTDSENKASGFGEKIGKAMKVAGAAMAAIATEAVAIGAAITKATRQVAEHGDEVDKMSQKLGLSAEAYQKWDYVLGQSGADINSMSAGMKTLTNQLDEAKNGSEKAQAMFEALGLSMDDLAGMSREEVFEASIKGFQQMADSTERAALANDLFGKSGQELTPLFNTSVEETQALMDATEELGMIMSDDAVKSSADYMDALDTLQRAFGGLKNMMIGNFLPGMTTVMDGLTAIFSGDSGGIQMIQQGVSDLIANLTENLPQFIETGTGIVMSIGQAIIENLPMIIDTAVQMIPALIDGLTQALPQLIEYVPDIIVAFVTAIIANLPKILESGIKLLQKLQEGIWKAIPKLVQKIPELIITIANAIREGFEKLAQAGKHLVEGIWSGISGGLSWIKDRISGWVGNVTSFIKSLFKISSPSKLYRDEIGAMLARGIGVGFVDEMQNVERMMQGAMPETDALVKSTVSVSSSRGTVDGKIIRLLEDIYGNMGNDIVLSDGVLVGRMDKLLGRRTMQRARGNA